MKQTLVCEAYCTRRGFATGKIHKTRGTEQRMTRGRSKTPIKATIGTVESQSQMRNKHKSDVLATKNIQTFASLKHIQHAYAVHTVGVISSTWTVFKHSEASLLYAATFRRPRDMLNHQRDLSVRWGQSSRVPIPCSQGKPYRQRTPAHPSIL